MQLILGIDDIGIKNNMSSAEEINRNEKEVKSPLIDKILSYSISNVSDDSAENEDQNVQENKKSPNDTVTCEEAASLNDDLDKNEENSQTCLYETHTENENHVIQIDDVDSKSMLKENKTDCGDNDEQEKSENESVGKPCELNCDKNDEDLVKDVDDGPLVNKQVMCKKDKDDSHVQEVDLKHKDEVEEKLMEMHDIQLEDFKLEDMVSITTPEKAATNSLENTEDDRNGNDTNENGPISLISVDIIDIANEKDRCDSTELENKVVEDMSLGADTSDEITENIKERISMKNVDDHDKFNPCTELDDSHITSESTENTKGKILMKSVEDQEKFNLIAEFDDTDTTNGSTENTKEKISLKSIEETEKSKFITELDDADVLEESTKDTKGKTSKKNVQDHMKSNLITELDDADISDDSTQNTEEKKSMKDCEDKQKSNLITELDKDISDESTANTKEKKMMETDEDHRKSILITEFDDTDISCETTERMIMNKVDDNEKSNLISDHKPVEALNIDKSHNSSCEAQNHMQNEENLSNLKVNSSDPVDDKTDPTNKLMNFKLSNMLDILSDDEDNHTTKSEPETESSTKQCINIEDDDDVMLIDDESATKENETIENNVEDTESNSKDDKDLFVNEENEQDLKEVTVENIQNDDQGFEDNAKSKLEMTEKPEPEVQKSTKKSPLLSTNTLKSFKKNLADMTREELEDFCILKIVESVFDKSNLGEIKSQIKVLAQNVEEYKAKAKMLTKHNRDLQLVLKSVQEEQKKNSSPIAPLKITRSVGMQVLMTDKNSRKRQGLLSAQTQINPNINSQSTTTNNKNQKSQVNPRNAKPQQPIPVPRLIPAVNMGTKSALISSPQAVNNPGKSPTVNNIPNGVKSTLPAAKPEKRSHSKVQQNSSVTVDLTDDEPPAKVINRNFNSSVRCVPPQTLLAPQRSPLPQNMNSPKKVYIPISGPQSQNIRPGQTIMLKSVPPPGTRPRGPSNNMKIAPNTPGAIRNVRAVQRHPAPLPDFIKQYQPPNWKGLPPAPELKLAKVENGIVISWKIDGYREENHEEIASYQLFAYQETSAPPNTSLWKKIGDVKALPLPMACTLTQFMSGYKYYFAVRAVDVRSRFGPFSLPGSILLLKNQ